ncbi:MAG: endopeptidase La [Gammaproteobacteria bacterium]|nr:endopeptidase La [Gammaproteobacteria bacterium]MBU1733525.1 endopeptidase La [Gammaproteobacteria bacterium]MBU1893149.1 endopeptidase La [Gammaproteobacteria bacterium]
MPEANEAIEGEVIESTELALQQQVLPDTLYLLPLTERPFFPAQTLPLLMNMGPWLETVEKIGDTDHKMVGLVLVRPNSADDVTPQDFYATGTAVHMHHPVRTEGKIQFIAEGQRRFRIVKWLSRKAPYLAQVEYISDSRGANSDEVKAYAMAIINSIKELLPLNPLYSEELKFFLNRFSPNEPSLLTDFAASLTTASKEKLQDVLEALNLRRRMEKVLVLIKKELDVARLQSQIREQVDEKMTKQQREFFLREQLKTIQKELGLAKDDKTAEIERFQERLGKLKLTEAAQKRVDEEMQKLSLLETGSPEYAVTRNYLDWLTQLPWGKYSKDKLDLKRARKILDRDHDGLEDVKERIIEFLAVGALKGEIAGSIVLLVGPPGVGKTSIGHSIADALGRKFYRFSLGGMRDEAEIKGHRRTYIGAMPGKFIQAIKECDTQNPVIMLDEVDKIGASYHGDPASSLLEVLDPEQNSDFLDHYLDVRFDLSKVLFVCTANQLDTIPGPLLDRMEVIRLSGYITAEKVAIAKHHLWPKQLEKTGLKRGELSISDAALKHVIDGYAREAGVRNLEKQLGRLVRKTVVKRMSGESEAALARIGLDQVEDYLGKPLFTREKPLSGIGVVTGLAWTAMGGATLSIEATRVHTRNRGFKMTGQLGDVMKESAEIAYSYVSSHLKEFKGDLKFFDEAFVHLHLPEGATPKDGPSAGVTMATALLSLARNQKIARPLAMTGELTLTGEVLAIGGVREKVIAARRIKIMELIMPESNRRDFDELPEHIKAGVKVHFARQFKDVARIVFSD